MISSIFPPYFSLEKECRLHQNLNRQALISAIHTRGEGYVTQSDSVVVRTGEFTGRTPRDKYIVESPDNADRVWWGSVNQPLTIDQFDRILYHQLEYVKGKDFFQQDLCVGIEGPTYLPLTVITESPWHSLFSLNLFKPPRNLHTSQNVPGLTILHTPGFRVDPQSVGINSGVFIIINLERKLVLIAGTAYAGEIKKSVFTVMNYEFPSRHVLTMHCSANIGRAEDTALFFGLSGTGKTTLSSSTDRKLIGDDEHGWMENGLINLEGGCYAKTIRLKESDEPIIWRAVNSEGSVLENVGYDPDTQVLDFDSAAITENTRAAYPLSSVSPLDLGKVYPHPKAIFFLTADAFGILPPISSLDYDQAFFHLLTGYTSKIAATEQGLGKEPCATFSTCFAEPFLPLHPKVYAELFLKRIERFKPSIWLINTGWVEGPYGTGHRIALEQTRTMIDAAIQGKIALSDCKTEPFFNLRTPRTVPGVPSYILNPRDLWKNKRAYDQAAKRLIDEFNQNYKRIIL